VLSVSNEPSKTIYVDLDDVLCEAARHFLLIVEREFGKRIDYEQLTSFDVGHACQLLPKEREELYRIVHRPEELLQMRPIHEAVEVLRRWKEEDFEVDIVTGRPPESYDASLEWLSRNKISYHSFTMVDKYSRFATANTIAIKLAELAEQHFCWAVEDSLPMAQYLASSMNVPVALIDCPWNRTDSLHRGVSRYRDWRAITEAVPALIERARGGG
jgi:uncharacterized HAD superfamily protein